MPRGEISSGKFAKRHPLDWYVEEQWVTRQLIDALGGFRVALANDDTIWDPCCGYGNVPAAFGELAAFSYDEFPQSLLLSDVVRNVDVEQFEGARWEFFSADFLELAELMCIDALHREESCGGHFRVEHQTPDGEALRHDDEFAYVAAWEYGGDGEPPILNKEPLVFENVALSQRSYK